MPAAGGVLIIKLGALGDVVRTTSLLRRLPGPVTWVSERAAFPLLEKNPRVTRLVAVEDAAGLLPERFELMVNFDEDRRACRLAGELSADRRVGAWWDEAERRVAYCEASAPWFDGSLVSRLGRAQADRLKQESTWSYQEHLFSACGLKFSGEEYMLDLPRQDVAPTVVGLETRAGPRWPAKNWEGFPALAGRLRAEGFTVRVLGPRPTLREYMADVNACGAVVCPDTLALHLALGLRKRVVGLFTTTCAAEIHGYGRLEKLVHPGWRQHFYADRPLPDGGLGIPVSAALDAARRAAVTACEAAGAFPIV